MHKVIPYTGRKGRWWEELGIWQGWREAKDKNMSRHYMPEPLKIIIYWYNSKDSSDTCCWLFRTNFFVCLVRQYIAYMSPSVFYLAVTFITVLWICSWMFFYQVWEMPKGSNVNEPQLGKINVLQCVHVCMCTHKMTLAFSSSNLKHTDQTRVSAGFNKSNLRLFKTFLRPFWTKFKTYIKYEKVRKSVVPELL